MSALAQSIRERAQQLRYPSGRVDRLIHIFVQVIVPILLMTAAGALLQRKIKLDVVTLSRLNIYLLVPAFLFVRVSESQLSLAQMAGVAAVVLIPMVVLGVPMYGWMRWRNQPGNVMAALLVGGLVFNAGNFGIPVAELSFGPPGGAVQALVVMMSNLSIWCISYAIIAFSKGHGMRGAAGFFKLPMIYTLVAALIVKESQVAVPSWINYPLHQIAGAVVPVGLITLGAQLSQRARRPNWRFITPVLGIKLLAFPAVTAVTVWMLDLWPWPGAQLILAAAGPTAMNTLLLTVELEGDADLAADAVFWTTLGSGVSVTLVLAILHALGGGPSG